MLCCTRFILTSENVVAINIDEFPINKVDPCTKEDSLKFCMLHGEDDHGAHP